MKTIVLRFSDSFAPKGGTINAHKKFIDKFGYVWWGKKGLRISQKIVDELLNHGPCKIILVKSGTREQFWAMVEDILTECPDTSKVPMYYRDDIVLYGSFLKITKIEKAVGNVLNDCVVCSSNKRANEIIHKSSATYFMVNYR